MITKLVDGVSNLNATDLNKPIYELEAKLNDLENRVNQELDKNNIIMPQDFQIDPFLINNRVVYFDGVKWAALPNTIPIGELIQKYPLGLFYNKNIYLSGLIKNFDSSIVDGAFEIGVPYFLTELGKITKNQPDVSIYIGQFISATSFILNLQIMTYSHLHRRALLNPAYWEDKDSYLLYPVERLDQLPLPVKSTVLILWGKYFPKYDPYIVDPEGIKIVDYPYFASLLGDPDIYAQFSNPDHYIECFWSNPQCLTTPGVTSLMAGTDNIIIENNIESQPNDVGNLIIKNIPVLNKEIANKESSLVVKDISVNENGSLKIDRGLVVEKIIAGNNTTIDKQQGIVTIHSNSYKISELEFSDVFLRGALSKLYPGTINTYIELPYGKITSAIFKINVPFNINNDKEHIINILHFGTLGTVVEKPLNIRFSNPTTIQGSYNFETTKILLSGAYYINKTAIKKITYLKPNSVVYLQVERDIDNEYQGSIGLVTCTLTCYLN